MQDLSQAEREAFGALCRKIQSDRGFYCSDYKDSCLTRRILVRMRAKGVSTFSDYAAFLDADPLEYDRLITTLTINVSRFFRNPETFACIASRVLPDLAMRGNPQVRIWSAGCAAGEEPYSLAVLCSEYALQSGDPAGAARFRVLGSDVDAEALQAAAGGRYPPSAFVDTTPAVRDLYFPLEEGLHSASAALRNIVTFEQRDILGAAPPAGKLHMILCRNVIIYFRRDTQERLFERFHELLLPGGFLVLGKVETLLGKARTMFAPVSARERIYRRL